MGNSTLVCCAPACRARGHRSTCRTRRGCPARYTGTHPGSAHSTARYTRRHRRREPATSLQQGPSRGTRPRHPQRVTTLTHVSPARRPAPARRIHRAPATHAATGARQSWHDGQPGAGAAGRRPEHRNHRSRPLRSTVGVQLEHADPLVATMHDAEPNPDTTSCAVEAAPRTCHSRRKAVWRRAGSGRPARPQSASGRARAHLCVQTDPWRRPGATEHRQCEFPSAGPRS